MGVALVTRPHTTRRRRIMCRPSSIDYRECVSVCPCVIARPLGASRLALISAAYYYDKHSANHDRASHTLQVSSGFRVVGPLVASGGRMGVTLESAQSGAPLGSARLQSDGNPFGRAVGASRRDEALGARRRALIGGSARAARSHAQSSGRDRPRARAPPAPTNEPREQSDARPSCACARSSQSTLEKRN